MSNKLKLTFAACGIVLLAGLLYFVASTRSSDPLTTAFRLMHSKIHDGDSLSDVQEQLGFTLESSNPLPSKMVDWYSDKKHGYEASDTVYEIKLMDRDLYFQFRDGKLVNHYNDMWDGDPHDVVVSGISN